MSNGDAYQAYTKGIDKATAAARFVDKYGHAPSEVIDGGTAWLVGPVATMAMFEDARHTIPAQLELWQ